MSYSNRRSHRAIPDITPYREPFAPSAYMEKVETDRQKRRKANLSKGKVKLVVR